MPCQLFSRLSLAFLFILSAFLMPARGHEVPGPAQVRVGFYENPPKIYTNPEGAIVGIFPDLLKEIAQKEGWGLTYRSGSWRECLARLERGQLDIMVDVAYSRARAEKFDFSTETIFVNYGTIYTRADLKVTSFLDLQGKTVAVMKGSIHTDGEGGIKNQLKHFDVNCNFVEVEDYQAVFAMLADKRADAGVVNRLFGTMHEDDFEVQSSPVIFNPSQLRFAFPKKSHFSALLKEQIDIHLKAMRNDPTSSLHRIISVYLSKVPEPWEHPRQATQDEQKKTTDLTVAEKEWLQRHPVIRVASDPHWEPVEFQDAAGSFQGMAIDYLRQVEKIVGVRFEIAHGFSWQELIAKVKNKEIDMFSCVTETEERSQYLNFTDPYLSFPIVIFTKDNIQYVNDINELQGRKVAVVKGYAIHDILVKNHPGLNLVPVSNISSGLKLLNSGKVTAFIGNLLTTRHYIRAQNYTKLKVGGETPYKNRLGMGVRNDWPELIPILQKAIYAIAEVEKNNIYRKWVPLVYEAKPEYGMIWKGAMVFLVILCLFLVWNRRLAQEVAQRKKVQAELTEYKGHLEELVETRTGELKGANQQLQQEIRERLQTEEALRVDEERLEALIKLNQMATVSEEAIINYGLEEGVRLSGSTIGYFHLIQEDQINLELFTWNKEALKGCLAPETSKYPLVDAGIWADSIRTGQPVIHNDYPNEPQKKGCPEGHPLIKRHMSVPVFDQAKMIAIFGVGNKEESYNDADIRQLTLLAQGMWALIQRQRESSEREMLKEQLRQTQKMEAVGTLAGGIAHDFNNILTAIIGFTELANEQLTEDSPIHSDLQEVLKAGGRAKDLVQQILTFSRQADSELKPILPHLIFKEALKLLRSSIPTTIELRHNIKDCGSIKADPTQLHQVIMNLCTNAYHAMRETGGVLGVSLSRVDLDGEDIKAHDFTLPPGPYVRLEVSDSGRGMDKATLAQIFNPYFTTKKRGEGTGLGLSVVHGIIKSLGGTITVYSEPQRGSTFQVYLPSLVAEQPVQQQQREPETILGGNERILVVDDEGVIIGLEEKILQSLGYEVFAFTDCEEALLTFQQNSEKIDLIITDMTMPHMTGMEFAQRCFEIRAEMPIILCTGFSELIDEPRAKALGIREYIMKPIVKRDLAAVVRKVLD
jgi:signal transduction histidine kinase/ABC-type amino acid transport substrate-binding protein/CheY-like chemotaxis protein